MILKNLTPRKDKRNFNSIYPKYRGQSLVNVPHMIASLLGVNPKGIPIDESLYSKRINLKGIKKVVLILLDGFGYKMWLDSNDTASFFGRISKKGIVIPITSTFPSTTAVAITSISTGLEPAAHGLPEWIVYLKEIKMIVNSLPFTSFINKSKTELTELGFNASILYKGSTIYQHLRKHKVRSFTILSRDISGSAYTGLTKRGSSIVPYLKLSDGVIRLREKINSERRAYIHMYADSIDKSTHAFGPFSEESRAEILSVSEAFEQELVKKVSRHAAKETLIMITADHGHTMFYPNKVIYLNSDRKLHRYLASDNGSKVLPTGSPRNIFLHIDPRHLKDAYEHLSKKFSGKARVLYSKDAVRMGLFGTSRPSQKFLDRIGDIIMLPREGELIWYEHVKGRKPKLKGVHGGLSENEMLVPLAMVRLSDIL